LSPPRIVRPTQHEGSECSRRKRVVDANHPPIDVRMRSWRQVPHFLYSLWTLTLAIDDGSCCLLAWSSLARAPVQVPVKLFLSALRLKQVLSPTFFRTFRYSVFFTTSRENGPETFASIVK